MQKNIINFTKSQLNNKKKKNNNLEENDFKRNKNNPFS